MSRAPTATAKATTGARMWLLLVPEAAPAVTAVTVAAAKFPPLATTAAVMTVVLTAAIAAEPDVAAAEVYTATEYEMVASRLAIVMVTSDAAHAVAAAAPQTEPTLAATTCLSAVLSVSVKVAAVTPERVSVPAMLLDAVAAAGQAWLFWPPPGHEVADHDLEAHVVVAHLRLPQVQAAVTAVVYLARPLAMSVPGPLAPLEELVLAVYVPV